MATRVVEVLNWLLAIGMWLVIGRAILDWITGGRSTPISRLFRLFTEPLYQLVRRASPRLSAPLIPVVLVLVFATLRILLVVAIH